MRAVWLADVLTDAGLKVVPYPGWETRGGDSFDPKGIILHHTVTSPNSVDRVVDRMLAETGSSKVPAPLANYSTNRDGTISLIAAGTANHGGAGAWGGLSGNRYFFGDEMKNAGSSVEPWPAVQLESARRAAAAICNHLGVDSSMVCGHKEYATPKGRKTDPHSLNMDEQRALIAGLGQQGDDMSVSEWAKNAWEWATNLGIFTTASKPQAPITVEQFGVFLKRYDNHVQKQIADNCAPVAADAVIAEIVDRLS